MGQTGITPGCSNRQLTSVQVYQYAYNAGFRGTALDEIVAIARAESGWNTCWYNINPGTSGTAGKSTKDRGLVQINDWWNNGQTFPNGGGGQLVSDACAYDPQCSMNTAFRFYNGNFNNFKAFWVTAAQGLEKKYLTNGPVGGSIIGNIGSVNGTTGSSNSSNPAAGATQTVSGTPGSSFPGTSDPCLGCGAVGSTAYTQCHAALAAKVGTPPACAQAGITANQQQIQNATGIDLTGISAQLAAIGQVITNLNSVGTWFQTSLPSALIKIGLFLVALILVGMGFFLMANAEELG